MTALLIAMKKFYATQYAEIKSNNGDDDLKILEYFDDNFKKFSDIIGQIESDPENVLLYSNAGALYHNILIEEQNKASDLLSQINSLNEQELEDLKLVYQNCLNLAQKARENFLMCNQLELDEVQSALYYEEAKKLKIVKNDLKSYIRKIDKKIDEL